MKTRITGMKTRITEMKTRITELNMIMEITVLEIIKKMECR